MLGINRQWMRWRALVSFLTAVVLVLSLVSCGDRAPTLEASGPSGATKTGTKVAVSEVSPPEVIQQLRSALEVYKPQVSIITPRADEVFQDSTVEVRFQVQDLPIFKDPKLGLGLHLNVILDNQPYQAVYDLKEPLVFKDLSPGTHTVRVFASRPWEESFKNEGAYAQTTFHIFTKTPDNNPNPAQPLLTYNRPTGSYGAEPIMLDFYLTNAPLHLVAREKPDDEIADWRIRVTVNGQSFVIDRWQPIYLKGFTPGKNWVQLEFLNELGNPVNNVFNNTVQLITYEPNGKDTLSKLVRGELSADDARLIVDPNYTRLAPTPVPSPVETPTPSEPVPLPSEAPTVEKTPATPEVEPTKPPEPVPSETKPSEKPQPGGFFNRFRQRPPTGETTPAPSLPEVTPAPAPKPVQPEVTVPPSEETPVPETSPNPSPKVETTSSQETAPTETKQSEKPQPGGFFNRFWRRPATKEATPAPSLPPALPEVTPTPAPEPVQPEVTVPPSEKTPAPSPSVTPTLKVEPPPVSEPAPKAPKQEEGKSDSLSSPSPSPTASPILPPTLPEVINSPTPPPLAEVKVPLPEKTPTPSPSVTPSPVLPPTLPEIIVTPSPSVKPDTPPTPQQQDVQQEPETSEAPAEAK